MMLNDRALPHRWTAQCARAKSAASAPVWPMHLDTGEEIDMQRFGLGSSFIVGMCILLIGVTITVDLVVDVDHPLVRIVFAALFVAAGAHTVEFFASGQGWQAGADESWGIDNFALSAMGSVPEPSSWAMLIAGFGLTGAAMRRRKVALSA